VVMTAEGQLVDVQGTAEEALFSRDDLNQMLDLAAQGIACLIDRQREALG
jgi:ribonuclease PH